jgi:GTP pyrophosphokinase
MPISAAEELAKKVKAYLPTADVDPIIRAAACAEKAHEGQLRKSGEPYIIHPYGVAHLIAELHLDVPSVCAALLHDCIEDTSISKEDIQKAFGDDIVYLVDGVTKLEGLTYTSKEERQAENFRKMLLHMARDIRVMMLKLADRLNNMRTLQHMSPEGQERIARETKDIYSPIAHRLGIQWMRSELEDLCFQYLYPDEHTTIKEQVDGLEKQGRRFISEVVGLIQEELQAAAIEAQVYGRLKHLWGVYSKLKRHGRGLDVKNLYDIMAFRILATNIDRCYQALGLIHAKFRPIPGRFKDYIAMPKENGYQSLHTSVWGPNGKRVEIQIRTLAMHRTAENGIAAHWLYKEGRPLSFQDEKRYAWLRQLLDAQKQVKDPTEFIDIVKFDLFDEEIYVSTPQGDLVTMPRGATPVDFAFAIHSEVGYHCSGAKVNGVIVPLKYELKSGDMVEILTNPAQHPTKDWLKFVATGRAKTKIRYFIRTEQRERSITMGRTNLEKELKRYHQSLNKLQKAGRLDEVAKELRLTGTDELLMHVGFGKLLGGDVAKLLIPEADRQEPEELTEQPKGMVSKFLEKVGLKKADPQGIIVQDVDDMLVRFAKCCNPVRGDAIVGYITRGRGVTVHTRDCPKAMDQDPERRVDVTWDTHSRSLLPVSVKVETVNRKGMLADLTKAFQTKGINITNAVCKTYDGDYAVNTFNFDIEDLRQLKDLMRGLQRIDGVLSVGRVQSW